MNAITPNMNELTTKLISMVNTHNELDIIKTTYEICVLYGPRADTEIGLIIEDCTAKIDSKVKQRDLIDTIRGVVLYNIIRAVDAHIERHRTFNVDASGFGNGTSTLDGDIVDACGIEFTHANIAKCNEYELVGELKRSFASISGSAHKYRKFVVLVNHEHGWDDSASFTSSDDFYFCSIEWLYCLNIEELQQALNNLEQHLNSHLHTTLDEALAEVRQF